MKGQYKESGQESVSNEDPKKNRFMVSILGVSKILPPMGDR